MLGVGDKIVETGMGVGTSRIGTFELQALLKETLEDWLGVPVSYFSAKDEGGTDFPLELMLRYEDPVPGILVFRADASFTGTLKSFLERRAPQPSAGRDLFLETAVRFYQKFMWMAHDRDCILLKPARFRSSRPSDWPHREPDASCLSLVERRPVEIRHWIGEAGR